MRRGGFGADTDGGAGNEGGGEKIFFDANLICYEKMCKNMKKCFTIKNNALLKALLTHS